MVLLSLDVTLLGAGLVPLSGGPVHDLLGRW